MKIKKIGFIIIVLTIFSLWGCGKNTIKTNSELNKNDSEQYISIILKDEPKILDPSKSTDRCSSQVLFEVNESLTRVEEDKDGKNIVKPAGAERWEVSPDQLKWTFYLRDNQWSDGKKVTAKDYEYGIKRTLDPAIKSQNAFLLYPIRGAKEYNVLETNKSSNVSSNKLGVRALDDKTLEITLERPCAYFLKLTSYEIMQPQRKDIVEKYGDKYGTEVNTLVFNGPFLIKQWTHNKELELIKNNSYWDAKSVKLEKIIMKIEKNDTNIMNEFLNDSLDLVGGVSPEWNNKLSKKNEIDILKVEEPSINCEIYNQNNKIFSNPKVRKAFSLAVDREVISKDLWKGLYAPAYGWIPPSVQIGEEGFREKANFEPIEELKKEYPDAKKLLIEGLKELGMEADTSKITISYLQAGSDINQRKIAEFFQKMYCKNLGINLKIEYVDYPMFHKRINSGEYQLASIVWTGDYNDPSAELNLWIASAGIIPIGWSNSIYDSLVGKANSIGINGNEERFEAFKEAENILVSKDAVISPIVYRNRQILKYKYVKGVMTPLFGPDVELKYAYTSGRNN